MASRIVTENQVRNVAAHHVRLFNRKLIMVPKRPDADDVSLLSHLSRNHAPKEFGLDNAQADMAYVLRPTDHEIKWAVLVPSCFVQLPRPRILTSVR